MADIIKPVHRRKKLSEDAEGPHAALLGNSSLNDAHMPDEEAGGQGGEQEAPQRPYRPRSLTQDSTVSLGAEPDLGTGWKRVYKEFTRSAWVTNFMGTAPLWYKLVMVIFLLVNIPVALTNKTVGGWLVVGEFIFTLAMALDCYPLQPGGLIAIESVVLGLTTPHAVFEEVANEDNLEVILLLMFMVAATHFLKPMLLWVFSKVLLGIRTKWLAALTFCFASAILSAFLDALTVTAVLITVAVGFYRIYAAAEHLQLDETRHPDQLDAAQAEQLRADREEFKGFLCDLMMHGVMGTALGGCLTKVGEPQNLIVAAIMDWSFLEYFLRCAAVSVPVFFVGMFMCFVLERWCLFGYGATFPESIREELQRHADEQERLQTRADKAKLYVQIGVSLFIVVALAAHAAPVGLIGLAAIVLLTVFNGIIQEHELGHSFEEGMPFTALLVTFFAVVSVIHEQHLFEPIIQWVLGVDSLGTQLSLMYLVTGVLSMISDNVFVASVYMSSLRNFFDAKFDDDGSVPDPDPFPRDEFDVLAVAVNAGTNVLSVATPNGQAAFLFLLTSSLASLIHLTYLKMVKRAFPYFVVISLVGFLMVVFALEPMTTHLVEQGIVSNPADRELPTQASVNALVSPWSHSAHGVFQQHDMSYADWYQEHVMDINGTRYLAFPMHERR